MIRKSFCLLLLVVASCAIELTHDNYLRKRWEKNTGRQVKFDQLPLYSRTGSEELPKIAGLDVLGLGMNMRYEGYSGAQSLLFNWTYDHGRTYEFSARGSSVSYVSETLKYSVPDQVSVRYIAEETREEKIFTSFDEFLKDKSKTFSKNINALFVSISIKNRNIEKNLKEDGNVMVVLNNDVKLFELSISLNELRGAIVPKARAAMLRAVKYPYSAMPDGYIAFLETFGTHYISQVVCGAQISVDSQFQNKSEDYLRDFMLSIGVSIPLASLSLDFDFGIYIKRQQFRAESISGMKVTGGIPDRHDLSGILAASTPQEVVNTKNMLELWKQTIAANPVAFSYIVSPVSDLFTDSRAREGMESAIECFYNEQCYKGYLKQSVPEFPA